MIGRLIPTLIALILSIMPACAGSSTKPLMYGKWLDDRGKYTVDIESSGKVLWFDNSQLQLGKLIDCSDPLDDLCFEWSDKTQKRNCRYLIAISSTGDSAMFIPLHGSYEMCPNGIFSKAPGSEKHADNDLPLMKWSALR